MLRSDPVTTYEIWHNEVTRERWLVRVEYESITGIFGPIAEGDIVGEPSDSPFEDHPDDIEWIVRYSEDFRVLPC